MQLNNNNKSNSNNPWAETQSLRSSGAVKLRELACRRNVHKREGARRGQTIRMPPLPHESEHEGMRRLLLHQRLAAPGDSRARPFLASVLYTTQQHSATLAVECVCYCCGTRERLHRLQVKFSELSS
jgi:hypothetical protein